jgi:hypothetical protein
MNEQRKQPARTLPRAAGERPSGVDRGGWMDRAPTIRPDRPHDPGAHTEPLNMPPIARGPRRPDEGER